MIKGKTFADIIWDFFILLPPSVLVLTGSVMEFYKSCPIVSMGCLGTLVIVMCLMMYSIIFRSK
jgi:hypothetical protein